MNELGTLIFFTGKMGVGKTTYAKELALKLKALYLSEDYWLSTIYPDEINDFNDYIKYSSRLKPLLKEHVRNLLLRGVTVIMDFPGNTKKQRNWFKMIFSDDNIPHKLVYLEADDELCLKQIEKRRISDPDRNKFDTKEVFQQVTSYFQAPLASEGFNIEIIKKT